MYDENGAPIGIHYREDSYAKDVFDCYYFEKNFQGDITGIFNEAGTQVVWYDYDAWGNRVGGAWVVNDQDIYKNLYYSNPFGYRGYYLDTETGFYYCSSRYYDPVIGRFINADSTNTLMNTPMAYTDKNLYAYCDNNPVMRVDNGGEFWDTVFDVVSLCFSVADVVKNPDDPWAWAGLAADVVSLAVPFAAGGGAVVKAVSKADDVVDLAKNADRALDTIDTVSDIGKGVGNLAEGVETIHDASKGAANICESACFIAGTQVETECGSIAIEDISEGMLVYAHNPETGVTTLKSVVNVFVKYSYDLVHISVNEEIITTTPTHPFWVPGKGWTCANLLKAGDYLQLFDGNYTMIDNVDHEVLENPVQVYNFEVEDFHTYFVGSSSILVHNTCKVIPGLPADMSTMGSTDILDTAINYLGEGYSEIAPGVFRSSDSLRQFRMTDRDLLGHSGLTGHVNFEALVEKGGKYVVNRKIHIFFID